MIPNVFARCAAYGAPFLIRNFYNKTPAAALNINAEILFEMCRHLIYTVLFAAIATLCGCNNAKLSVAEEQYARGEYYDASVTYKKVYNKLRAKEERPLRGQVAYKMGLCYRLLNMSSRASAAFQNALRYEYPDSTAYLYLAQSQHREGKYAAAIKNYEQYRTFNPKDDSLAIVGIEGCKNALAWRDSPTRYEVKNAKLFNSRRSDFSPMYFGADNDQLYFSSTTEKATGDKKSEITGMKNADIFFAKKNENG